MNNQQFTVLRKKIEKFDRLANMTLWHGGVAGVLRHRLSLHKSQIEFSIHHIQIPYPNEIFVFASNNDVLLATTRLPLEVEEWKLFPTDIYEQVVGDVALFDLRWGEIVEVPTTIVRPIVGVFESYYRASIAFPTVTVAAAERLPYKTHMGKIVFAPNPSLSPQEQGWVVEFQTAKIEGREIPDRPEFTLGERLSKLGLWNGIEWDGGLE